MKKIRMAEFKGAFVKKNKGEVFSGRIARKEESAKDILRELEKSGLDKKLVRQELKWNEKFVKDIGAKGVKISEEIKENVQSWKDLKDYEKKLKGTIVNAWGKIDKIPERHKKSGVFGETLEELKGGIVEAWRGFESFEKGIVKSWKDNFSDEAESHIPVKDLPDLSRKEGVKTFDDTIWEINSRGVETRKGAGGVSFMDFKGAAGGDKIKKQLIREKNKIKKLSTSNFFTSKKAFRKYNVLVEEGVADDLREEEVAKGFGKKIKGLRERKKKEEYNVLVEDGVSRDLKKKGVERAFRKEKVKRERERKKEGREKVKREEKEKEMKLREAKREKIRKEEEGEEAKREEMRKKKARRAREMEAKRMEKIRKQREVEAKKEKERMDREMEMEMKKERKKEEMELVRIKKQREGEAKEMERVRKERERETKREEKRRVRERKEKERMGKIRKEKERIVKKRKEKMAGVRVADRLVEDGVSSDLSKGEIEKGFEKERRIREMDKRELLRDANLLVEESVNVDLEKRQVEKDFEGERKAREMGRRKQMREVRMSKVRKEKEKIRDMMKEKVRKVKAKKEKVRGVEIEKIRKEKEKMAKIREAKMEKIRKEKEKKAKIRGVKTEKIRKEKGKREKERVEKIRKVVEKEKEKLKRDEERIERMGAGKESFGLGAEGGKDVEKVVPEEKVVLKKNVEDEKIVPVVDVWPEKPVVVEGKGKVDVEKKVVVEKGAVETKVEGLVVAGKKAKLDVGKVAQEIMEEQIRKQRGVIKKTLAGAVDKTGKVSRKYVKTGIEGFDALLTDGIPEKSTVLVAGGAGSGKTIFCLQTIANKVREGKKCLYMSFEEKEDKLIRHMEDLGWEASKMIKEGNLKIQRTNPFDVTRNVDAMLAKQKGELLIDIDPVIIPRDFKPDFIFLDSLTAIASAFTGKEESYRIYIEQLFRFFEKIGATSFLITETEQMPKIFSTTGVEEFLADGVIVMYNLKQRNVRENAIEILKLRGAGHAKKIVALQITAEGIVIYPDQEVFSETE